MLPLSPLTQLPVLPAIETKVYTPILVSNSSYVFPYGSCEHAYNASCITFQGPTITNYSGYQTLSFVLKSNCSTPLSNSCAQDIGNIQINSCRW